MTAVSIDFHPDTETTRPFFVFKQEGFTGLTLFEDILPELVAALKGNKLNENDYFWNDICVHKTKTQCKILKYAIEQPLLQIDSVQLSKLIAHLTATYPDKT